MKEMTIGIQKPVRLIRVRRGVLLLALMACAGTAMAQDAATPAASSAQAACLVKPTEPLKYPKKELAKRMSGILTAKLTFTRPDRAPKVEILFWGGSSGLADAAEIYLLGYRLPCLGQGESVALEQTVNFTALATEPDLPQMANGFDCVRTPGPFTYDETMQTGTNIKQKERGNLLVLVSFDAPDQPPKVTVLYDSAPSTFSIAVMNQLSKYRLPCFTPGAAAETMQKQFSFKGVASGSDLTLRDVGLLPFLRSVKEVDKVPVKFDLSTMACPFQARFRLYQPATSNYVYSIGKDVPERKPFFKWLSTLALNIDQKQFEALMGAEMVIDVPCGTIQL